MKNLGFGLGLRAKHYNHIQNHPVNVDWFEALTENYFGMESSFGGPSLENLLKIRQKFPIVLHGVSLSIASSEPFHPAYLKNLTSLIDAVQPEWISDHICWTHTQNKNLHDLFPVPFTEKMLNHLLARTDELQNFLKRRFVFENVSSYLLFQENEMTEWEFISEFARRSGAGILLDINNIYVNSRNHNFNPYDFLNAIPKDSVVQFHLAGASDKGTHLIDTHDREVRKEVWDIYLAAVKRFGQISTMVEWDSKIPEFSVLENEVLKAKFLLNKTKERRKHGLAEVSAQL